ncbi:DNA-primase RepB domain-containing protein [Yoonia sp. 208BN28-4]|uniref:DNA-primase RepB domain-containing protein n=1 Tax=Yoonia sp. 208BN28-4 TaxID=3126505 RepID=UPI00309F79A9
MPHGLNNPALPIHSRQEMKNFLQTCWKVHGRRPDAFVCIATYDRDANRLRHRFIRIRNLKVELRSHINDVSQLNHDIYFCPNATRTASLAKENVLATPYLHADIDDAEPDEFNPRPNILWETSPGRFQGLWTMKTAIDADLAQNNSKRMAYAFGADKNGHAPNKLLRVPGSINLKPTHRRPRVRIIRDNWELKYSGKELKLDLLPPKSTSDRVHIRLPSSVDYAQIKSIWNKYRTVLYKSDIGTSAARFMMHRRVYKTQDRSGTIYCIIAGLHSVGATRTEIATVLVANPYFQSKHGTNQEAVEREISRCIASWESKNG